MFRGERAGSSKGREYRKEKYGVLATVDGWMDGTRRSKEDRVKFDEFEIFLSMGFFLPDH